MCQDMAHVRPEKPKPPVLGSDGVVTKHWYCYFASLHVQAVKTWLSGQGVPLSLPPCELLLFQPLPRIFGFL